MPRSLEIISQPYILLIDSAPLSDCRARSVKRAMRGSSNTVNKIVAKPFTRPEAVLAFVA